MAPQSKDQNRLKPNVELVGKIDEFAADMIDLASGLQLDERKDVLAVVTKWIAVRHKLVDVETLDGAGLSNYRTQINRPGDRPAGYTRTADAVLSTGAGRPRKREQPPDSELGSDLESFANRLPDADVGDVRRDSEDPVNADYPLTERARRLRDGLSGNGESD